MMPSSKTSKVKYDSHGKNIVLLAVALLAILLVFIALYFVLQGGEDDNTANQETLLPDFSAQDVGGDVGDRPVAPTESVEDWAMNLVHETGGDYAYKLVFDNSAGDIRREAFFDTNNVLQKARIYPDLYQTAEQVAYAYKEVYYNSDNTINREVFYNEDGIDFETRVY